MSMLNLLADMVQMKAMQASLLFSISTLGGYHLGRLENYDNFLRKHLRKNKHVLSIASGRCANELFLMEDGYSITCSDLGYPSSFQQTKTLFPNIDFVEMDILEVPPSVKYDAIIALSLIYLFDESDFGKFFKNVSDSLNVNGSLILDSAGSPDNFLSFFIHDILLKYETCLVRFLKRRRRHDGLVIKDHGFRRTDIEIIELAKKYNLELVVQENYGFLVEFARSGIFSKIFLKRAISLGSITNRVFSFIGKGVPYTRMYMFKKVS